MLSGEATNTNISLWFDPIRAQTQDLLHANHYTTNAVFAA
jgi:hypothetical protein